MTEQEMRTEIARLQAENAALSAKRQAKVTVKVSEKGAVSVYGLGRFPVTLYRGQMEKLLDHSDEIRAFITANAAKLSVKPEVATPVATPVAGANVIATTIAK